ncbi:hypothetical protein NA56DRAFT_711240 [Hyaloscypha hepaticicola]|uniref:Uncharacterized protein n=1 Tax=Hyaloscypha hepaticicola TaxID=2082293 RepID=A0A2J6PJW3_9HELO|nr:hypothetical protein NA56DRAFT_711240 [Hyaloscypha hepaticicola]
MSVVSSFVVSRVLILWILLISTTANMLFPISTCDWIWQDRMTTRRSVAKGFIYTRQIFANIRDDSTSDENRSLIATGVTSSPQNVVGQVDIGSDDLVKLEPVSLLLPQMPPPPEYHPEKYTTARDQQRREGKVLLLLVVMKTRRLFSDGRGRLTNTSI